jgi:hypothetical protein
MTILARIFRRDSAKSRLVGTWRQVGSPNNSIQFFGDGRLEYRTIEGDRVQISKLTYQVSGNEIISNQPSAPREERTTFAFEKSGVLRLTYQGEESRYEPVA